VGGGGGWWWWVGGGGLEDLDFSGKDAQNAKLIMKNDCRAES